MCTSRVCVQIVQISCHTQVLLAHSHERREVESVHVSPEHDLIGVHRVGGARGQVETGFRRPHYPILMGEKEIGTFRFYLRVKELFLILL